MDYDLLPEEYEQYAAEIQDIEDRQEKCKVCNGLEFCTQTEKGIFPMIESQYGKFGVSYAICSKELAERKKRKIDRLLLFAQIPAEFENSSLDDIGNSYRLSADNKNAVMIAKHMIENDDDTKGAFFFGSSGTGKSNLAAIILNEKIKKGIPGIFANVPYLLNDIKNSFKKGNTEELLRTIMDVPFLVIDDLGSQRMTQWVGEQLFMLINARSTSQKQTVFTANYNTNELYDRLSAVDNVGRIVDNMQGKRIMSRIFGLCYVVRMDGKDYRRG